MTVNQPFIIGLIGAAVVLITFVLYNLRCEKITASAWFLWMIGDSFDLATYKSMVEGDAMYFVPAAFALGSVATFFIALFRRRFERLDPVEYLLVAFDALIMGIWLSGCTSASAANLLLQVSTLASFYLLYRGIYSGRDKERTLFWMLWTLGNLCFFLTVRLSPHAPEDMVYPIVGMITHAGALIFIFAAAKKGSFR